eukprot:m.108218 g.108218  ORF g.108218 m.108218 type:complete len:300 (+) comp9002_c0_seq5:1219-2118(+)
MPARLVMMCRRVRAKQAPSRAYAAVPGDDRAKLEKLPHRCDFSKLTGMFGSAYVEAQENGILPAATSLSVDMVRRMIEHEYDHDQRAQPLTWRSTLEFQSIRRRSHTTNFVTFRMANDGFLYLNPTPRPIAVSASDVMHDIAPSTSVTSIPPSVGVARVLSYMDFVDIMEAARYPYPRHGSLNRPPMTEWFQLRSYYAKVISQGALAPMQTAFCDWIAASRDITDCGPLNAELYYNAEDRRVDIIMTVRLAAPQGGVLLDVVLRAGCSSSALALGAALDAVEAFTLVGHGGAQDTCRRM